MPLFTRLGKKKPATKALPSAAPASGPVATVGSPPMSGLATGNGPRHAWTHGRAGGGPSGSGPTLGSARIQEVEQHEGEHEEENPYNNFDPSQRSVRDKDAQDKTLVEFRGGQLVRSSTAAKDAGKPVDTKDSVTHFTGPGWEIFVVDQNNNIHMASHKVGKFHHSSLIGGGEVSMAGEMKVSGGKIEIMSNKSGHYLPSEEMVVQFLHFLEKDGVPLDFTVRLLAQGGERTAKQMLEGKVDGVTADPKKTYEIVKTNVVWRAFVEEFGDESVMAVIQAQGWRGKGADIVDKDNKPVDPKLVRRLLKQELGGARRSGKTQAKVQVQEQKLVGNRPVVTDTKWQ